MERAWELLGVDFWPHLHTHCTHFSAPAHVLAIKCVIKIKDFYVHTSTNTFPHTITLKLLHHHVCMPKNLNVNKQFGNKDSIPSESILTYSELQLDLLDLIK